MKEGIMNKKELEMELEVQRHVAHIEIDYANELEKRVEDMQERLWRHHGPRRNVDECGICKPPYPFETWEEHRERERSEYMRMEMFKESILKRNENQPEHTPEEEAAMDRLMGVTLDQIKKPT